MPVYSIKDLEKMTGVKAHTIRIWEKRYSILEPKRTSSNIRYYEDDDLQKILNVVLLNKNGWKISKIASLSEQELRIKVAEFSEIDSSHEIHLDALMISMLELDDFKFNRILDKHIESKGMLDTMEQVIYPFLDRLGNMWFTGSISGAHENFVSYLLRRKLIVSIDSVSVSRRSKKAIIYLPEGELQELTLLYLHLILLRNDVRVINLGHNVSIKDVVDACRIIKPEMVFTFFNDSFSETSLRPYLTGLSEEILPSKLIISGYQVATQNIEAFNNVSILNNINELSTMLTQFAKA